MPVTRLGFREAPRASPSAARSYCGAMTRDEVLQSIAARPEADLHAAAAGAAYGAALAAQQAGAPSSVVAGILTDYARAWEDLEASLGVLADG